MAVKSTQFLHTCNGRIRATSIYMVMIKILIGLKISLSLEFDYKAQGRSFVYFGALEGFLPLYGHSLISCSTIKKFDQALNLAPVCSSL